MNFFVKKMKYKKNKIEQKMHLCEVVLNGYLFEDEGSLNIGNYCLVSVDGYYMIGTLHSYNTTEFCFKECKYYVQDIIGTFILWTNHKFKPYHWVSRENALVWCKSTKTNQISI